MISVYVLPLGLVIVCFGFYQWLCQRRYEDYKLFPQLQPDLFWGHMRIVNDYMSRLSDRPLAHTGKHRIFHTEKLRLSEIDYAFRSMAQDLGVPTLMLLDMRPLARPCVIVHDAEIAEKIVRSTEQFKYSTEKSVKVMRFEDLTGKGSIVLQNGEAWKASRKRFNPGFATAHLMSLLPKMTHMCKRFIDHLDKLCTSGEVFTMGLLTENLTFDIIGSIVVDLDFKAQGEASQQHPIVGSFKELAKAYSNDTPLSHLHPYKRLVKRYKAKALNKVIKEVIAAKFEDQRRQRDVAGRPIDDRSVLALSFHHTSVMTAELMSDTTDQLKTFLFAGHDTTSTTLQWALYELHRYPHAAKRLREELDGVFGPETGHDAKAVLDSILTRGEEALSQLTYTSAVIKEVLRLYPPAGTARAVPEGSNLMLDCPEVGPVRVDGTTVYVSHFMIQRDRRIYGATADIFNPDRWVDERAKEIPAAAWQPFSRGPRNCIGQELANIEAKLILACVYRRYEFTKVGVGALARNEKGEYTLNEQTGGSEVEGGVELYNRRQIISRPVDDTRMVVRLEGQGGQDEWGK